MAKKLVVTEDDPMMVFLHDVLLEMIFQPKSKLNEKHSDDTHGKSAKAVRQGKQSAVSNEQVGGDHQMLQSL
ncbi:MAG TPA: hypothetical protein VEA37_02055 [Flavobacterium sp.]|nr:hypothetical protein [Flavobacterium sp.]